MIALVSAIWVHQNHIYSVKKLSPYSKRLGLSKKRREKRLRSGHMRCSSVLPIATHGFRG